MKNFSLKTMCAALCALILLSGCGSMNNTAKGGLIGAGGGAVLGAIVGKLAGNTAVGAAVGTAVGAGTGAIIGRRMDKAAEAAAEIQNATVETVTDANNLTAVKVTFDSGVLFATNKYDLNAEAKKNLREFANILKEYNDADVAIFGHTDSTGSDAINDPLSVNRANSVASYLKTLGVSPAQIKNVEGFGSKEPVADNSTVEGRAKNRRVEVYMYASEAMINAANNGQLQ
ncbi:MAG: OmpA family protein [Bacteroidaceae bacterium]|nr:OmpA family protein [Bacteroidaceae bacterium]MBQ3539719.1 OmpA family protein [Bacteroidaceae bacterium]MBQ6694207.1 OmpA family protein [Bacteroidaceae bacterium]MBR7166283.1 OmpA family protein [Bacteroidaceae bacterium]